MKDFWQNGAERLTRKMILNRGLSQGTALVYGLQKIATGSFALFGLSRVSNWLIFMEALTKNSISAVLRSLWRHVVVVLFLKKCFDITSADHHLGKQLPPKASYKYPAQQAPEWKTNGPGLRISLLGRTRRTSQTQPSLATKQEGCPQSALLGETTAAVAGCCT